MQYWSSFVRHSPLFSDSVFFSALTKNHNHFSKKNYFNDYCISCDVCDSHSQNDMMPDWTEKKDRLIFILWATISFFFHWMEIDTKIRLRSAMCWKQHAQRECFGNKHFSLFSFCFLVSSYFYHVPLSVLWFSCESILSALFNRMTKANWERKSTLSHGSHFFRCLFVRFYNFKCFTHEQRLYLKYRKKN